MCQKYISALKGSKSPGYEDYIIGNETMLEDLPFFENQIINR